MDMLDLDRVLLDLAEDVGGGGSAVAAAAQMEGDGDMEADPELEGEVLNWEVPKSDPCNSIPKHSF
jgi:hypothetical protein